LVNKITSEPYLVNFILLTGKIFMEIFGFFLFLAFAQVECIGQIYQSFVSYNQIRSNPGLN
jgi:hypothetical protein